MAIVSHVDLQALPNLPGYNLEDARANRPQTFAIVNGTRIEMKEGLSHEKPKFVKAPKPVNPWRQGSLPHSTTREDQKKNEDKRQYQELPAWDALDRHVLRFYGYFKEAVVETNLENYRVRRIKVYYYLEDDTMLVNEPKQDNSGLAQGQLIRRHRFPLPDGGYMTPKNLRVGEDIHIYGKTIRLTDCDDFTRNYYKSLGEEQDMAFETETDPFARTQTDIKNKDAKSKRTYEKIYREVMLGGGHVNADMQQFLEMDKKVLRFFGVLDDLSTPQFERRPFIIMFYLQDDSIEIREQYPLNCGRDNFPLFFKKGKLPMGPVTVDGPQAQPKKKSEYVHGHDLSVNQHVTLMGYNFFIYDADEFTRQYFSEVLGIELEPKADVQLPDRAVPRAKTPPYTGYGSWEDSMGSVMHLIPKPPKKDFVKLFNNEGKIMRFTAKFAKPKPEDVDRMFVINFHLFDDTVSVHEPPQRNLGIITGLFLHKAVHVNQITGKLFGPDDFAMGDVVKVLNHEFVITGCDEFTEKMMANPNMARMQFDLHGVLEKLRESMRQQFPLVRDIFRRFDSDHDGVITAAEFKQGLEKFGFLLPEEDVMVLMRHFDTRQDGQISYNEFCDVLLDEDYTDSMLKCKPPLETHQDPNYAVRASVKSTERVETDAVRKAVREIGDVMYKKVNFQFRLFREFAHLTHLSVVSCEQIQYAFQQLGHSFDIADVQRCVLYVTPEANLDAIPYVDFFQSLQASYHDLANVR
jgi:Ca2+-binding EF-hand superfamily protein